MPLFVIITLIEPGPSISSDDNLVLKCGLICRAFFICLFAGYLLPQYLLSSWPWISFLCCVLENLSLAVRPAVFHYYVYSMLVSLW